MADACTVFVLKLLYHNRLLYPMQTFECYSMKRWTEYPIVSNAHMQLKCTETVNWYACCICVCVRVEEVHGHSEAEKKTQRGILLLKRKQCKLNNILLSLQNIHSSCCRFRRRCLDHDTSNRAAEASWKIQAIRWPSKTVFSL